jgi:hypothetical protein
MIAFFMPKVKATDIMGGIENVEDDDVPSTSGRQDAPFIFVLENASLETAHVGKVHQNLQTNLHKGKVFYVPFLYPIPPLA